MTATALNDQGQFSVNGQRADANYFTVDGVSANFGVSARRLAIAQQVAFAKWDSGAPVEDASGEEHVIVSATDAGQLRRDLGPPRGGRLNFRVDDPGLDLRETDRSGNEPSACG